MYGGEERCLQGLVEKSAENTQYRRSGRGLQYNIKTDLYEVEWGHELDLSGPG